MKKVREVREVGVYRNGTLHHLSISLGGEESNGAGTK